MKKNNLGLSKEHLYGKKEVLNKKMFYFWWVVGFIINYAIIFSIALSVHLISAGMNLFVYFGLSLLVICSFVMFAGDGIGLGLPYRDAVVHLKNKEKAMFYYDGIITRSGLVTLSLLFIGYDLVFYTIFAATFIISLGIKMYIGCRYILSHEVFPKGDKLSFGRHLINRRAKYFSMAAVVIVIIVIPAVVTTSNSRDTFFTIMIGASVVVPMIIMAADVIDYLINSLLKKKLPKDMF